MGLLRMLHNDAENVSMLRRNSLQHARNKPEASTHTFRKYVILGAHFWAHFWTLKVALFRGRETWT